MVTRREAELARACRLLVDAYKRGEASGSVDWEDVDQAHAAAVDALKVKASYGRRRAVVTIKGGAVCSVWSDKGVRLRVKDLDEDREQLYTTSLKRRGRRAVPKSWPVQPLKPGEAAEDRTTCGDCGRAWDDGKVTSITPTPAGRCPFESWH